jgi:hypothetical protein
MTPDGKPDEETEMPLYGGIDLHANNSVVVLPFPWLRNARPMFGRGAHDMMLYQAKDFCYCNLPWPGHVCHP